MKPYNTQNKGHGTRQLPPEIADAVFDDSWSEKEINRLPERRTRMMKKLPKMFFFHTYCVHCIAKFRDER